MICIYCDQEILAEDEIFFLAFELPYANIKVHRTCYKTHKNTDFIEENTDKILIHIENVMKSEKK